MQIGQQQRGIAPVALCLLQQRREIGVAAASDTDFTEISTVLETLHSAHAVIADGQP